MTAIPILKGVYSSAYADFIESFPTNLEPEFVETGLSKGYLKSSPGITAIEDTGPGADRGSITWRGVCYRVMGSKLVKVVGETITVLGDVRDNGLPVTMDFSFDRLGIASNLQLYYWNDTDGLQRVTDPDLGDVIDMLWIDGYWMTTDGTSIVVTELNNPFSVNPSKYGSSEEDPDPIVALRKVRGEVYAVNTNTIENFQNVGGNGFPFQRNSGALIPTGSVGTHASAYFIETFAFVGCARNEALSVYLAGNGEAISISTPQIDREIARLTDAEKVLIEMESRVETAEQRLLIHLPSKTLVYYRQASAQAGTPIWTILASGKGCELPYDGKHLALADGRWLMGNADGNVGYLDNTVETHFGNVAGWRFDTAFLYNGSRGGIIKSAELVGLPGRAPFTELNPTVFLSVTRDGATWSVERAISMGAFGERRKRVQWRPKLRFSNYVGFRFRGSNTSIASWARLEADIEPLAV
jgi:stabilization protein